MSWPGPNAQASTRDYPYWWDVSDLQPAADHAGGRTEDVDVPHADAVDVAIIGGGYTGLSAARALALRGATVVVFERGRIGSGASSRNAGQVLPGFKLDPKTLVSRYGEARARQLFEVSLRAIATLEELIADEHIACDYQHCGHVQAASKPSHFDGFLHEQALLARVFGHRVEVIARDEQRREIGSDAYYGLLVDSRSAALNPARYLCGLASAAARAGAQIAEQTPVERFARRGRGWTVRTPSREIAAADVIVATNGYTDRAAPQLQRRLIPIGSYIIVTAPLPTGLDDVLLPKRRMAFDSRHFVHYFRMTPDHRLLFGGRAEFERPTADSTRRAAAILKRDMTAIFPQLSSLDIDYAWSGNVAFTRDQMPRAGRLDGAYFAGGYCGHGIAMATYLGALLARIIGGEAIEHPLVDDAFAAIPLYSGNPWFLPIVGAYYRVRDWLE